MTWPLVMASGDNDFARSLVVSSLSVEEDSDIETDNGHWITSQSLAQSDLPYEPRLVSTATDHLLTNPNLISPNLFRADILHDSSGTLQIVQDDTAHPACLPPSVFSGFSLKRTVVRRFIPRNPNKDSALEQTCHMYEGQGGNRGENTTVHLATYYPHVVSEQDMPFYHPLVRGYALLYEFTSSDALGGDEHGHGTMSVHFLPFSSGIPAVISTRFHRILLNLLSIHIRITRGAPSSPDSNVSRPFRDNLIPQHVVQNMYTKLKAKYATTLVQNWVEVTEPSKHVFEDISIAAFLIELFKVIYNIPTSDEDDNKDDKQKRKFPGFVDVACGNGVLVYLLLSEGYDGWGFDARLRKTWSTFPSWIRERLKERICIPQPFMDTLAQPQSNHDDGAQPVSGIFGKGTFIISNHADELTLWTPLLGLLSNPSHPLPFLAIPCCSHSLSGARYRHPPPHADSSGILQNTNKGNNENNKKNDEQQQSAQPASGDLMALRAHKLDSHQNPGSLSSTYGCLTAKLISLAEEVGYDAEKTILRIPSTRNIGVIGGLKTWQDLAARGISMNSATVQSDMDSSSVPHQESKDTVQRIVERESAKDGDLHASAMIWVERSRGLRIGQGRGKLNGGIGHDDLS